MNFVEGELRLAGAIDRRMIDLLKAIDSTGSISQAAKLVGLSYKGAWQIIEGANSRAPRILISTTTGGSKGGGTFLTDAGRSLLLLYNRLEKRHSEFISQLNQDLLEDVDTLLLLQRMAVKASAINQLFGTVTEIVHGAVNAMVTVELKDGTKVVVTLELASLSNMGLTTMSDAFLLLSDTDIILSTNQNQNFYPLNNKLRCKVIRMVEDELSTTTYVGLPSGESLAVSMTHECIRQIGLIAGSQVWALFSSGAPILGIAADHK
ncbi:MULTISPECIES: TOBE domain-containing protein [Methylomonas]|uniref:TOBE domain-containing protein n=1 Tax=Methylomonas TaxID=416 RepID=UPI0012318EFC|nr:TOBE domain-containing protein [Methylomonas rhizoryzae]